MVETLETSLDHKAKQLSEINAVYDALAVAKMGLSEHDIDGHTLFQRHLASPGNSREQTGAQNFDILLAAQALERIGDHAKNLAEEIYGLAEGRSLRHTSKKITYS